MCIKVLGRTGVNINEKLGIIERLKRQCWGLVGSIVLNIRFSRNVNLVFSFKYYSYEMRMQ